MILVDGKIIANNWVHLREFQKKSIQGSKNRMSEIGSEDAEPSSYTSGSLSRREHAKH